MDFTRGKFLACGLLAASLLTTKAQQFQLESVGMRFGFSANASGADFHEADAEAIWSTPLFWDLGKDWWLKLDMAVSSGWLGDPGHNAFVGSAGANLVLWRDELPVSLEGGVSPTFLSEASFGTKNFGSNAQFTTHAALNYDLSSRFRLYYRFQHMSNAGLSAHNPGLNLHMFGASYLF